VDRQVWTTRSLLAWLTEALERKGVESGRLCAEMLLAHVLGCERMRLYLDPDRPASPEERHRLRELAARALKHEPVQYLVEEAWFFSLPFAVDRRVLIPRPSTETIVEHVLQRERAGAATEPRGRSARIADVCTGSGCIAIALAKHMPHAKVVATDVSAAALEVARTNVQRHGVSDRVLLLEGDLLEPLQRREAGSFLTDVADAPSPAEYDYLVSNPPYIPDSEWHDPEMMGRNVKGHEPEIALRGGPDGLTFIRRLVSEGPVLLRTGGMLAVEVAASTAQSALELARTNPLLGHCAILKDGDGLPRVLIGERRG